MTQDQNGYSEWKVIKESIRSEQGAKILRSVTGIVFSLFLETLTKQSIPKFKMMRHREVIVPTELPSNTHRVIAVLYP